MTDHRWAVAAVVRVDEAMAAEIAAMDLPERLERLHEIYPALGPDQVTGPIEAVRGPICEDCRVHWRDVHAQPDKPWPCPGRRPEQLGGPLVKSEKRLTRQERRAQQRQAVKSARERSRGVSSLP